MVGFLVGMIAAGLWLAVMVGVGLIARASPGHPAATIRRFRRQRRALGRQRLYAYAAAPAPTSRGGDEETTHSRVLDLTQPAPPARMGPTTWVIDLRDEPAAALLASRRSRDSTAGPPRPRAGAGAALTGSSLGHGGSRRGVTSPEAPGLRAEPARFAAPEVLRDGVRYVVVDEWGRPRPR